MNHSRLCFYTHNCCLLSSGIFASYNSLCFLSSPWVWVWRNTSNLPQRKKQENKQFQQMSINQMNMCHWLW